MYLDDLANSIRAHIPDDRMPGGDAVDLLRIYAVLLRAKGPGVTSSDIHDAWAAWIAARESEHESLLPYEELDEGVQEEDRVFAVAVRRAAEEAGVERSSTASFKEILFPSGPPANESETSQALDLYKMMVESSERLVGRRQGVNTFFLTINGVLLTASGLIVQSSGGDSVGAIGIAILAVAGVILCGAWRSLINSFGQLNRGKFQVINTLESYLRAAVYAAEWEALGRGEDPKIYRSFTSREIWVPNALLFLHALTAVAAMAVALGWIVIGGGSGPAA